MIARGCVLAADLERAGRGRSEEGNCDVNVLTSVGAGRAHHAPKLWRKHCRHLKGHKARVLLIYVGYIGTVDVSDTKNVLRPCDFLEANSNETPEACRTLQFSGKPGGLRPSLMCAELGEQPILVQRMDQRNLTRQECHFLDVHVQFTHTGT